MGWAVHRAHTLENGNGGHTKKITMRAYHFISATIVKTTVFFILLYHIAIKPK